MIVGILRRSALFSANLFSFSTESCGERQLFEVEPYANSAHLRSAVIKPNFCLTPCWEFIYTPPFKRANNFYYPNIR
jgi:hypothetical protein